MSDMLSVRLLDDEEPCSLSERGGGRGPRERCCKQIEMRLTDWGNIVGAHVSGVVVFHKAQCW